MRLKLRQIISVFAIVVTIASCTSDKQKMIQEISKSESELMNDTSLVLNVVKGKAMQDLYLKYADTYNTDTLCASYLFKAADLSNGMHDPNKAVELLGRMLQKYPTHPKCSDALFLQAFLYDTELKLTNSAKEKYKEFIQRFPNDALAPSAVASLQQLESSMSDEELVKKFQRMNDSLDAVK